MKKLEPREEAQSVEVEETPVARAFKPEDYPYSHPLPEPFEQWRVVDFLTPDLFSLIGMAYAEAMPDQLTWWDWATVLANNLVLIGPSGFFVFENVIPNGAAEIHGAKWPWHQNVIKAEGHTHSKFLRFVMAEAHLNALYGILPKRAKAALAYLEFMGFQKTGLIPLRVSYNGVPENCVVMTLLPED